jgi:hypothetical protein
LIAQFQAIEYENNVFKRFVQKLQIHNLKIGFQSNAIISALTCIIDRDKLNMISIK